MFRMAAPAFPDSEDIRLTFSQPRHVFTIVENNHCVHAFERCNKPDPIFTRYHRRTAFVFSGRNHVIGKNPHNKEHRQAPLLFPRC